MHPSNSEDISMAIVLNAIVDPNDKMGVPLIHITKKPFRGRETSRHVRNYYGSTRRLSAELLRLDEFRNEFTEFAQAAFDMGVSWGRKNPKKKNLVKNVKKKAKKACIAKVKKRDKRH